jgi:hypothetical protein
MAREWRTSCLGTACWQVLSGHVSECRRTRLEGGASAPCPGRGAGRVASAASPGTGRGAVADVPGRVGVGATRWRRPGVGARHVAVTHERLQRRVGDHAGGVGFLGRGARAAGDQGCPGADSDRHPRSDRRAMRCRDERRRTHSIVRRLGAQALQSLTDNSTAPQIAGEPKPAHSTANAVDASVCRTGPGCDHSVLPTIVHNEAAGPPGSSSHSTPPCGPNGWPTPAPAIPAAPAPEPFSHRPTPAPRDRTRSTRTTEQVRSAWSPYSPLECR